MTEQKRNENGHTTFSLVYSTLSRQRMRSYGEQQQK